MTYSSDDFMLVSAAQTREALKEDLLIEMSHVTVVREGRALLEDINWQVELDERWIIMGPNGSGKTTLMTLAAAQIFPTKGTVHLMGEQMGKVDLQSIRTGIGVTSSAMAHRIPNDEKAEDIILSAGYDRLGRWKEEYEYQDFERAEIILELVGAVRLRNQPWGTLSEGERKRVLIARALMSNPEILLLDEPSSGLDLGGREDLIELFTELAYDPDSPAIIMVTHHVEEIPPGFTHGLLLGEGGRIIAQGLLEDVMTSENVSNAYNQNIVVTRFDGRFFARRIPEERVRHRRELDIDPYE